MTALPLAVLTGFLGSGKTTFLRGLLAEPAPILATLATDPYLERHLRLAGVTTIVDALLGAATLDRHPEATAQAVLADVLLISKTDLAPLSPELRARLAALNPAATLAAVVEIGDRAGALFDNPARRAVRPLRAGLAATAAHGHGIASFAIVLRRDMSRLEFAQALGGLARERGEDLLRVKGLVAFADRPGGPAAIHAVQHTLYAPEWLADWPDQDRRNRLVLIVRGISTDLVLSRFVSGDPVMLEGKDPFTRT